MVHVVANVLLALARAVRPPYGPASTADAPLSAVSTVTWPVPAWVPVARTVTPTGGVNVVVVPSRCIQYDTTTDALVTFTVGVVLAALLVVINLRAKPATGLMAAVPR